MSKLPAVGHSFGAAPNEAVNAAAADVRTPCQSCSNQCTIFIVTNHSVSLAIQHTIRNIFLFFHKAHSGNTRALRSNSAVFLCSAPISCVCVCLIGMCIISRSISTSLHRSLPLRSHTEFGGIASSAAARRHVESNETRRARTGVALILGARTDHPCTV